MQMHKHNLYWVYFSGKLDIDYKSYAMIHVNDEKGTTIPVEIKLVGYEDGEISSLLVFSLGSGTPGARVSEIALRHRNDALPGKRLGIRLVRHESRSLEELIGE